MEILKKFKNWKDIKILFCKMLRAQFRLKRWLENLDKIDREIEFNQWELQSILKNFLIDELKEEEEHERN